MVSSMTDISDRVHTDLMNDPNTKNYANRIQVAAERNIVTLTGTVPSAEIMEQAERVARNTAGVVSVHNELKVQK